MTLILSGTNGLSDVDGSAATPAIRGTDSNTGIFFPAADTIAFAEGGTEVVRIDSSGNLGIGTSSPTQLVSASKSSGDVIIKAERTSAAGAFFQGFETGSTGSLIARFGHDNSLVPLFCGTTSNHSLGFYTNNTERARIDSSGNLLVNTTGISYGEKFSVINSGASGNCGYFLYNSTDDRDVVIMRHQRSSGSTGGTMISFLNSSGTSVGTIRANGTVTAYNTTSDYRLKEDVQPMTGALAKVAALKPVTYKWKSTGEASEGFIAHELQEVVPDCVSGAKDAVDAEGNPRYQGIDTSFLVATLTAAIQEQQALITSLTARIAALEGAAQ